MRMPGDFSLIRRIQCINVGIAGTGLVFVTQQLLDIQNSSILVFCVCMTLCIPFSCSFSVVDSNYLVRNFFRTREISVAVSALGSDYAGGPFIPVQYLSIAVPGRRRVLALAVGLGRGARVESRVADIRECISVISSNP